MLREAELAADRLRDEYGVDAEVWSVTSYSELARDGREAERARLLSLPATPDADWVRPAWATARPRDRRQRLRARRARTDPRSVPAPYRTLGTDGFGRSDTRAQLRDFFEVGRDWIVLQALDSLGRAADVQALRERLGAATRQTPPWAQ